MLAERERERGMGREESEKEIDYEESGGTIDTRYGESGQEKR